MYQRNYVARNRERWSEIRRKSQAKRYAEGYRQVVEPRAHRAHRTVAYYKETGRLTPQPCEICGEQGEAHHDDYAKPLEVRWLCHLHHMRRHAAT